MSAEILSLEPKILWNHFYRLTQIPRPSEHEAGVRASVVDFAKRCGLEWLVDEAGNVIVRKPATAGMERRRVVVLQAHLDMVPQKNAGTEHDFATDPIDAVIDGEWVRARGTTLGADNGIGVAAALGVLESAALRHGPLEALFTANEEAGMTGALGLKPGVLDGDILLNLDSEDEGELFIGCAGGLDGTMRFDYSGDPVPPSYTGVEIRVSGLRGGHSGMDINLGRGNANTVMNRLLRMGRERHGLLLAVIDGGSLRNAIPRESVSLVAVPSAGKAAFLDELQALAARIGGELAGADPELCVEAVEVALPVAVIEDAVAQRLFEAVAACPNGVHLMSAEMAGLVETSNNLARVHSDGSSVSVECLLRSASEEGMGELADLVAGVAERAGTTAVFEHGYPGWRPNPASPILKCMIEVYRARFGKTPEIRAVHAGLECGIIGATCPQLDMISFGPTIRHPHSPDEKVEIASVLKFWEFLTATLEAVPER
ncbi:cytosol nonspecific dipeptidase [Chlorobaculum limnaeum]|uniref:Cytosol non-specific dipeptidase n=1 Tax=Chlorobaculum limnaeum TaxID=274537 RepID=A0A1D8CXP5_CHLLM|nr:aminoacyl-histidine dipeptidase [Chlorobaculum limnaeum]AOS83706.1 cytosol nonspecific dipeptidase [Chlorobaculum limnaeum]